VADETPRQARWTLDRVARLLRATAQLLELVARNLRELVHAVGWLILLVSAVGLLFHPHLTVVHLALPGGGALAVLQSVVKRRGDDDTKIDTSTPAHAHRDMDKPCMQLDIAAPAQHAEAAGPAPSL
jgi:hypothetical protein